MKKKLTLKSVPFLKGDVQKCVQKLEPLQFLLCQENGSSTPKPCTSCESGPNFVHPRFKETFQNIECDTADKPILIRWPQDSGCGVHILTLNTSVNIN